LIDLRHDDGVVALTLTDDGRGLPTELPAPDGHHGLRWLAERVEGLGGRFRIGGREPHGVELQVRLPLASIDAVPQRSAA
jgi:two-component system sensor histidine kinase UhpB